MKFFCNFIICLLILPTLSAQLLTIGDQAIRAEEFSQSYEKNVPKAQFDEKSVNEYLSRFIISKLKVKEALDLKVDQTPNIKRELANYREQLAIPYLTDAELQEKMLREAYENMSMDVHARQIMVRVSPYANAKDTLAAYRNIMRIRNRLIQGEKFEVVAKEESAKGGTLMIGTRQENIISASDLKYFTAFAMPYRIEQYVFHAEIDAYSMPIRSDIGYHIVQVLDRKPTLGKIKASQIFVGVGTNDRDVEIAAKERIDSLYQLLMSGRAFEDIARQFSDDKISAIRGGEIAEFNVSRMDPVFISHLYGIPDGVISKPFRAENGYHIVMMHSRSGIDTYDNVRPELIHRLNRDPRAQLIQDSYVKKLLKEYKLTEYPGALNEFKRLIGPDTTDMEGFWMFIESPDYNKPLYKIDDVEKTLADLAKLVEDQQIYYRIGEEEFMDFLKRVYKSDVANTLISMENNNLEKKFPDFKALYEEYRDGILIYEMTDRKIWSKSTNDTTGLMEYYDSQKHCYMWPARISALIFKYDVRYINTDKVRKFLEGAYKKKLASDQIIEQANRNFDPRYVSVTTGIYEPGNNKFADRVSWEDVNVLSQDIAAGGYEKGFVYIYYYYPPTCKSLDEVRGIMVAQFQAFLEEQWVKELKEKYPVKVNQEVLKSIIKK